MPTENEIKYILDQTKHKEIEKSLVNCSRQILKIKQNYLSSNGFSLRIRSIKNLKNLKKKYFFTLKTKIKNRVIELEQEISERDYKDLYLLSSTGLKKVRYIIPCKDRKWEIDFIKDKKDKVYCVLAEVELPEGIKSPSSVPELVKDYLIYKVPLTDQRFSNKLLCNVAYAKKVLRKIKK